MKSKELRALARKDLKGKWGRAALLTLIYMLTTSVISYVLELLPYLNLGKIINIIITPALSFGILSVFIKLSRGEDSGYFDFFKNGFEYLGKLWSIILNVFLKLLIFVILAGISGFLIGFGLEEGLLISIIGYILYIVTLVFIILKSLFYVLTSYILFDEPNLTGKEIVNKSELLMKGNRWRIVCLELSFIGWALLSILTFGIGIFWFAPYAEIAVIKFYEEVSSSNTSTGTDYDSLS